MYNIRSKYSIFGSLREIQILSQKHSVKSNRLVRRVSSIFFSQIFKNQSSKNSKHCMFEGRNHSTSVSDLEKL